MKLIIKEREVEYQSDYPEGWKFSAGDPFKFPVTISGYPCFIKRFEKKSPEDVSGWELLQKLKGKFEPNLPRIHDIQKVVEGGKPIHYLFQEYIDGATIEQRLSEGSRFDLQRLTDDIFAALRSIHSYDFWFVDFCEKNIFAEKTGRFLLVDLDSASPSVEAPSNDMYGSKDYWIPVYAFYKEALPQQNIRLSDIKGPTLNYLQTIFLILHLKLFYDQPGIRYNSNELHSRLPGYLNSLDPAFKAVFLKALQESSSMISEETIAKIKSLIAEKIIRQTAPNIDTKEKEFSIISFTSSASQVKKGEPFTLNWQIDGADKIELNRNGLLLQTLGADDKKTERTEFHDSEKAVTYELVAYKKDEQIKSAKVVIQLKQEAGGGEKKKRKNPVLFAVAGILALILIGYFLFNYFRNRPEVFISANTDYWYEGSAAVFHIKNIDPNAIIIYFNDQAAQITAAAADSVTVKVPVIEGGTPDHPVSITVRQNNGKSIYRSEGVLEYATLHLADQAFDAGTKWTGCQLKPDNETCLVAIDLPKPGTASDVNGFVIRSNQILEDKKTYMTLFTHPNWASNGSIKGLFPQKLQKGKKIFKASVGFVQSPDVKTIDGVTFRVKVITRGILGRQFEVISPAINTINRNIENESGEQANAFKPIYAQNKVIEKLNPAIHALKSRTYPIIDLPKIYTGALTSISKDFPEGIGQDFTIELRVDAGATSNVDWAAWVDPRIETRAIALHGP